MAGPLAAVRPPWFTLDYMGVHTSRGRDTTAVLDAFRRIVQALRASSRRAERDAGLSGAQLFVLQQLDAAPAASLNELAARTHTHQSSVSTVVARLVARRLVRRTRSGADGRSVTLSLTPRGRVAAGQSPDVAQARLIDALARLAPSRRRQLALGLGQIARAMDGATGAPAMFFEERRPRGTRLAPSRSR